MILIFLMVKGVFYQPASIIFSMQVLLFPTENAIYSTQWFLAVFYPIILIPGAIAENSGPTV